MGRGRGRRCNNVCGCRVGGLSCQAGTVALLMLASLAYSDILNSPKLATELQDIRLGSLLPAKQIRLLEAVFLSNEVVSSNAGGGAREGSVETDTSA